jgi:hypothetical protein
LLNSDSWICVPSDSRQRKISVRKVECVIWTGLAAGKPFVAGVSPKSSGSCVPSFMGVR